MIRYIIILFLLLIFTGKASCQDIYFDLEKLAIQESRQKVLLSNYTENASSGETDFIYQRMEWQIDPAVRYISGKVTSCYKPLSEVLDTVYLDLHQDLHVDSVTRNSQKIQYKHLHNKISIPITDIPGLEQVDSFSVYYHGVPPGSGFGSFETNVHGSLQTPVLWTLSEPYGAMEWWPCKQSLNDKIDSIDVIVTTPQQYRTASNGILVNDEINDNLRTVHWKHRHPIAAYLVAIAATDYVVYSDTLALDDERVIDILNYVYPENLEIASTQTPVTAEVMQFYNQLVDVYPFADEKYGHAQFGWGGGMEHQTMSFMGGFTFGLIAHELAHQWFGDYITTSSWQDIWLNEGFATYLNALAIENLKPNDWPGWKKSTVENIVKVTDGAVFVTDTSDVNRVFDYRLTYQKAAYILHMLRWVLGDENFFNGLRNYYHDPEIANNFATTAQLQKHMEEAGDTSLQEFFNDWYYGEGYPVYALNYWQPSENELRISLSQSTTHPSVGFFEMQVPVRLYNSDRTQTLDLRLNQVQNNQTFTVNPGFQVSFVELDPDYWLLSKTDHIVNVPEISDDNTFSVYPNPASTKLYFSCSANRNVKAMAIFDMTGKMFLHLAQKKGEIDISYLPSGTYLFRVEFEDGLVSQKFIVQKD